MTYGTEYPFDHLDSAVPVLLHSNLLPAHAYYTLCLDVQIIIFSGDRFFFFNDLFSTDKNPSNTIKEPFLLQN